MGPHSEQGVREGLSPSCLPPHLGLWAAVGQGEGSTPSRPRDLSQHHSPRAVKLGRAERSAAAHGGHSVWDQLSGRGGVSETLVVSLRKRSPREGGDPTLLSPPATQKSNYFPCPSGWMPCRARGCPPGQNPAPWGPLEGPVCPGACHTCGQPPPPRHCTGPWARCRPLILGWALSHSQECSPGSLASIPRREGWHLAPLACGEGSSSPLQPPPPKLSWEPWSRLVRLQGRSAPSHAGSAPLCAGPYGSSHRPFLDSQPPPSVAPHSAGEDIEGQKDQASRAGFQLCPLPPRLQTGMGTPLP